MINGQTHILSLFHNKTIPQCQITVTQHNVRVCVSVCKVGGGWSCKDVDGGPSSRQPRFGKGVSFPSDWEERERPLNKAGWQSGSKIEPRPRPSDKMDSLNNESIWDLWATARWAPSLNGHGLLIPAKSTDSRPRRGCSQSYIRSRFSLCLHYNGCSSTVLYICRSQWGSPAAKKTRPWKKSLDGSGRDISRFCLQLFSTSQVSGKLDR